MIKKTLFLLLGLYALNAYAGPGGYIGTADDRRYSTLSDPTYAGVAKLDIGGGRCTGGFVGKNLVLTNKHCALHCTGNTLCTAEFWDGKSIKKSRITPIYIPRNARNDYSFDGTDWAVLKSDIANPLFRPVAQHTQKGSISRGGFGVLRVITNDEIPYLRQVFNEVAPQCKRPNRDDVLICLTKRVDERLIREGRKPLFKDSDNFKVQQCNILYDMPGHPKMVKTDCDSAGGDSGAPLLRGRQIVGLNNSGQQIVFGDTEVNANGVKTDNFYSTIAKIISDNPNKTTEPKKPSDPKKPSEPKKPTEPNKPVEPAPNEPNEPVEPAPLSPSELNRINQQRLMELECD